MKKSILIIALTMVFGYQAEAKWLKGKLPKNLYELSGAFKGRSDSGRTSHILAFPIYEDGQPSGRLNLFLLDRDLQRGQAFEAYVAGGPSSEQLAVLPVGVDPERETLHVNTPAGKLEVVNEYNKRGQVKGSYLRLVPTNNRREVSDSYKFTRVSDDVKLLQHTPSGRFVRGPDEIEITRSTSLTSSVRTDLRSMDVQNDTYNAVMELAGISVLRPEVIGESLEVYPLGTIKSLIVPIQYKRRPSVVVGKPSLDGSMVNVQVLRQK